MAPLSTIVHFQQAPDLSSLQALFPGVVHGPLSELSRRQLEDQLEGGSGDRLAFGESGTRAIRQAAVQVFGQSFYGLVDCPYHCGVMLCCPVDDPSWEVKLPFYRHAGTLACHFSYSTHLNVHSVDRVGVSDLGGVVHDNWVYLVDS